MKKHILHFIAACLFLVLLVFSNDIVGVLFGDFKPTELDRYESVSPAHCYIDTAESTGSILEKVSIQGWAFAESDESDNREVVVLLKSDRNCYAAKAYLKDRKDVFEGFKDTTKISGTNVGVVAELSTFNIKSGVYDILFYCKENNAQYGIIKANYQLIKNGRDTSFQASSQINMSTLCAAEYEDYTSTAKIYSNLDVADITNADEETIALAGWAFAETSKPENKEIQILFVSDEQCYSVQTEIVSRLDVLEAYKENKEITNDHVGFSVNVSLKDMKPGTYKIFIYNRENDQQYGLADTGAQMQKDDKGIRIDKGE